MTLTLARPSATELLGIDVSHSGSAQQALVDAGLADLEVIKVPIQTATHGKTVFGKYALETHERPLPNITVGDDYNVVQFEANADVLDAVARRTGATFANAGALSLSQAFVSLVLPDPIEVGDDRLIATITAFMSHGTGANHLVPGACRILCANQQPQLLRAGRDLAVTVWHTSSAADRTAMAEGSMMATVTGMEALAAEGRQMLAQTITDDDYTRITDLLYPLVGESKAAQTRYDKRMAVLSDIYHGPSNANIVGTAWGAYQAITEYTQWAKSVRAAEDVDLDMARARRALTSSGTHNDQIKAYTLIREMFALAG